MKDDADEEHEEDEEQYGLGDEVAELARAALKFGFGRTQSHACCDVSPGSLGPTCDSN